jgi:PAS domain S-box-containing protein
MLSNKERTKEQLVSEMAMLRQQVAELEALESERKQAETIPLAAEDYYRLFELFPIGVTVLDMKGMILYCNAGVYNKGGYYEDNFVGKHFSKIAPVRARDIPKFMRVLNSIVRGKIPKPLEVTYQQKDGTTGWTEINIGLIKVGGKRCILVIQHDITERKQAEEKIKQTAEEWRTTFDSITDLVSIHDKDFKIARVNKAYANAFKLKPQELIGRTCYEVVHETKEPWPSCPHKRALETKKSVTVEFFEPHLGIHLQVLASPIFDDKGEVTSTVHLVRDITERKQAEEKLRGSEERFRTSVETLLDGFAIFSAIRDETGRIVDFRYEYINDAGCRLNQWTREQQIGHTLLELLPAHKESGLFDEYVRLVETGQSSVKESVLYEDVFGGGQRLARAFTFKAVKLGDGFAVDWLDITERKQAEEREKELQQELGFSRRLASVGELAASVGHEINNPLTGILGFSERLLRKSTDEEIRLDLERIHDEAQRIAKVMDNLRTFTRRREPEKKYSDINDILQKALELRAYELRTGNIEVVTDFTPSLPEIEVDFHQIQEVFLNIILNAEQAMTEARSGSKLTIKTEKIKDYVRISFTDDGLGIPAEHLDKLFDPFFTTRGEQGGTGLGLSVCHGIVVQHGGRLYARSKPGKGATFFVELP